MSNIDNLTPRERRITNEHGGSFFAMHLIRKMHEERMATLYRGDKNPFTSVFLTPEHRTLLLSDPMYFSGCKSPDEMTLHEIFGIKIYIVPGLSPSPQFGYTKE